MMPVKEILQKAQDYKGQSSRSRYIVNFFRNDEIPMVIFSYLWTNEQSMRRIKELNSKSKEIITTTFVNLYSSYFTQIETCKPEPLRDYDFDDFSDLEFNKYKDVHIHQMEIYESDEYLNGMEIYYLVDGDLLKYTLHHRIKRSEKAKVNPMSLLQADNTLGQSQST